MIISNFLKLHSTPKSFRKFKLIALGTLSVPERMPFSCLPPVIRLTRSRLKRKILPICALPMPRLR